MSLAKSLEHSFIVPCESDLNSSIITSLSIDNHFSCIISVTISWILAAFAFHFFGMFLFFFIPSRTTQRYISCSLENRLNFSLWTSICHIAFFWSPERRTAVLRIWSLSSWTCLCFSSFLRATSEIRYATIHCKEYLRFWVLISPSLLSWSAILFLSFTYFSCWCHNDAHLLSDQLG